MKDEERGGKRESGRRKAKEWERKRKGDASIHGESIVSFISVPPRRLSFSFSSGPRAWRSPYCDSVIVVRFWKIAHCESVLKTGGFTESSPSHRTSIRDILRICEAGTDRSGSIKADFPTIFIAFRLFMCIFLHIR